MKKILIVILLVLAFNVTNNNNTGVIDKDESIVCFSTEYTNHAYIDTSNFPSILYSSDWISDYYIYSLLDKCISYDAEGNIVDNSIMIVDNQLYFENGFMIGYLKIFHVVLEVYEVIRYQYIIEISVADDGLYNPPVVDDLITNDSNSSVVAFINENYKELAIMLLSATVVICCVATLINDKKKKKEGK